SWLCREKNLWRYTHLTTRSRRPSLYPIGRRHHRIGFLTGLSHLSRHHPHRSNLIRRTIRLAHFGSRLPQTTEPKAARHCQSSGSVAGLRSVPDAGLVLADGQLAFLDSQRTRDISNSGERIFDSKLPAISVERRDSRTAGAGKRRFG